MEELDGSLEPHDGGSGEEELVGLAWQATAVMGTASLLVWAATLLIRGWQRQRDSKELRDTSGLADEDAVYQSPFPLTKLHELEHASDSDTDARQAFSKEVEIVDLITPPTTGSRKTALFKAPPTARSKPAPFRQKLAAAVTGSGAWHRIMSLLPRKPIFKKTPSKRHNKVATPGPAVPSPSPQGWDPALLASCQQREAYISGMEGLQQSKDFQQHIRSTKGNLDRYMAQVDTRLNTYQNLRTFDRAGFMHLLTRQDIQEYDSQPSSLWLCMLEGGITTAVTFALFMHGVSPGGSYTNLACWLALQMYGWWSRYSSFVGKFLDMLCVQECTEYPDHTMTASLWRVVVAGLLDALLPCITIGAWAAVSLLLQVCRPSARQTLGQWLVGIRPIKELDYGQVTVPQFPSPTPKIQRPGLSCVTPGGVGFTSAATPASTMQGTTLASKFGSPTTAMHEAAPKPDNARPQSGLVGVFGSARKRPAAGQAGTASAAASPPKSALRHVQPRPDGAVLFGLTPTGKMSRHTPSKPTPKVFNDSTNNGFTGFNGPSLSEGVPAPTPAPASAPGLAEQSPHGAWTWGSNRPVLPPADLLFANRLQQPEQQQQGGSLWGSPASQY